MLSLNKFSEYTSVATDEESQARNNDRYAVANHLQSATARSFILQSLLYIALFSAGALTGYRFARTDQIAHASVYTKPWFKELQTEFNVVQTFNGTLDAPSKYRGSPSDEIDAAWNWTTHVGPVDLGLDYSDIESLGVDPDTVARYPDGVYMVELEFSHQLHCLNLLRMASHMDYYKDLRVEFRESEAMTRTHLDHCIEMLRQTLMCNADVNVYPDQWVGTRDAPYPNFNVQHTCRDFDSILEFSLDHRVPNNNVYPSRPMVDVPLG